MSFQTFEHLRRTDLVPLMRRQRFPLREILMHHQNQSHKTQRTYNDQSDQTHLTYHRRSVPSVPSVLSVPKTKTRHPALHDECLDFLLGPMGPIGRMGPIRFVSRIDRRDGIDHDGSYRLGIGLIPLIESPGLDRDRSLITHQDAFSERAAELGQSVIIECCLHHPASSVTPSLSSLKGCHVVTRVTQSQGSLRHCATTSK